MARESRTGADDDLVGQVVGGRYKVEKLLGAGGMGTVYKAIHTTIGHPVALKVLQSKLVNSTDVFRRFRQEAKAASKIGHDNIVSITDFGSLPDGAPYFVMEYLEGEDLATIIERRGAIDWRDAYRIGIQICSALQAAHDAGIIHRDVKPDNFFLTTRGEDENFIKVLDFGIAKLVGDEASIVTRTGVFLGTPEYTAPEQVDGLELDPRVDIYGVGILLYQLIVGHVPFRGDDEFEILDQHMNATPTRPSQARPRSGIPARAEGVILRALEKDRRHRHQSMADFAKALQKALDVDFRKTGVVSGPIQVPISDDDEFGGSSSRVGLYVGIGLAVAAIIGVGVWLALS